MWNILSRADKDGNWAKVISIEKIFAAIMHLPIKRVKSSDNKNMDESDSFTDDSIGDEEVGDDAADRTQ